MGFPKLGLRYPSQPTILHWLSLSSYYLQYKNRVPILTFDFKQYAIYLNLINASINLFDRHYDQSTKNYLTFALANELVWHKPGVDVLSNQC